MHAGDASTASTTSKRAQQHTVGSLQSSQVTTQGSTGQQSQVGSLADAYQAAYPTQAGGTTFAATMASPQAAPAPGASSESKQEYVQYQIDSLKDGEVLDGLVLQQGLRTRLLGGVSDCCLAGLSSVRAHLFRGFYSRSKRIISSAVYCSVVVVRGL